MNKGIIVKGIGGFYYVDSGGVITECKARGHFRNKKLSPCVGDRVVFTVGQDGKGSIDEICERSNIFVRPPVCNIDEMIIVASVSNPSPDLTFIDKMLVIAEYSGVGVKICFNKFDLDDGNVNEIVNMYRNAGYVAFTASTVDNIGIEIIRNSLRDKITAFSGFSGVGKSSLLNAVTKSYIMPTGEVSERLRRGKHTTRHVELISYGGGYIVDTPGFSMLDFPSEITKETLKQYFKEFDSFEPECRFRGCNHMGAASVCRVCKAAENGEISLSRYNNYKSFYAALSQRKEWEK